MPSTENTISHEAIAAPRSALELVAERNQCLHTDTSIADELGRFLAEQPRIHEQIFGAPGDQPEVPDGVLDDSLDDKDIGDYTEIASLLTAVAHPHDDWPKGFVDNARTYLDNQDSLWRIEEELDERFGLELHSYALAEAEALQRSLDKDKIKELVAEQNKSRAGIRTDRTPTPDGVDQTNYRKTDMDLSSNLQTLTYLMARIKQIIANGDCSFKTGELELDTIDRLRAVFDRWGVINRDTDDKDEASHTPTATSLTKGLQELNVLNRHYRTAYPELVQADIERLAAKRDVLPMYEWAAHLEPGERARLAAHLKGIDAEKELSRMSVCGLDKLPVVISEDEIKEHLRRCIPPVAFEGVRTISFAYRRERGATDEQLQQEQASGYTPMGHHDHDTTLNNSEIVIWIDWLDKLVPFVSDAIARRKGTEPTQDFYSRYIKEKLWPVLDHEFGHALSTVLPVELLRQWHEAIQKDDARVTDYVKRRYDEDHQHRYTEDFAESFAMFMNDPARLYDLSALRYLMMYEIFGLTQPGHETVQELFTRTVNLPAGTDVLLPRP